MYGRTSNNIFRTNNTSTTNNTSNNIFSKNTSNTSGYGNNNSYNNKFGSNRVPDYNPNNPPRYM